jgi:hypothetical protein
MPKEPHKQQTKTSNRSQTTKLQSNKHTYQHGKQPNGKSQRPHGNKPKTESNDSTTTNHTVKRPNGNKPTNTTTQHQKNGKSQKQQNGNSLNKTATSRTTPKGKRTADKHRTLPIAFKTTSTELIKH